MRDTHKLILTNGRKTKLHLWSIPDFIDVKEWRLVWKIRRDLQESDGRYTCVSAAANWYDVSRRSHSFVRRRWNTYWESATGIETHGSGWNDAKVKKCLFFSNNIGCLGYVISPRKLKVLSKMTDEIERLSYPKDVSHMRSMLGLCCVHRRFASGFALLTRPLNKWCEGQTIAFWINWLREGGGSHTKAEESHNTGGGIVPGDGSIHNLHVRMWLPNRLCTASNARRSIVAASWLLIMDSEHCREALRHEIIEMPIPDMGCPKITSLYWKDPFRDKNGLSAAKMDLWFQKNPESLTRWRLRLMELDFEVVLIPGLFHNVPDALFRLQTARLGDSNTDDELHIYCIKVCDGLKVTSFDVPPVTSDLHLNVLTIAERNDDETEVSVVPGIEWVHREQKEDKFCCNMSDQIGRAGKQFRNHWNRIIYRQASFDGALTFVVAQSLRLTILFRSHYLRTAGQPGEKKCMVFWGHSSTGCTRWQTSTA